MCSKSHGRRHASRNPLASRPVSGTPLACHVPAQYPCVVSSARLGPVSLALPHKVPMCVVMVVHNPPCDAQRLCAQCLHTLALFTLHPIVSFSVECQPCNAHSVTCLSFAYVSILCSHSHTVNPKRLWISITYPQAMMMDAWSNAPSLPLTQSH